MNRRAILTSRFITIAALVLACGVVVPFVLAQWQTGGRVNNELYGNTGGSVRYSSRPMGSTQPLSSRPTGSSQGGNFKANNPPMQGELRHAYLASGALPSEVRAQAAQVGPLPREGPIAYIPAPRKSTAPPPPIGNRVDPSLPANTPLVSASAPNGAGAIRHSSVSQGPINAEVTGKPLSNESFLFTPVSTGTSTPSLAAPAAPNPQQPALPRLPTKSWDSGFDASDLQAGSIRYGSGGG